MVFSVLHSIVRRDKGILTDRPMAYEREARYTPIRRCTSLPNHSRDWGRVVSSFGFLCQAADDYRKRELRTRDQLKAVPSKEYQQIIWERYRIRTREIRKVLGVEGLCSIEGTHVRHKMNPPHGFRTKQKKLQCSIYFGGPVLRRAQSEPDLYDANREQEFCHT